MIHENLYYNLAFYFIFGTMIGSFINALGSRMSKYIPKYFRLTDKYSIFTTILSEFKLFRYANKPKRSHCFSCKTQIKWYHNIPIFSYILLRGKCGYCGQSFSPIYMISEATVGFLFALGFYLNFYIFNSQNDIMGNLNLIMLFIIFTFLYLGILIDLKTKFIPWFTFVITLIPFIYVSNHINGDYLFNNNIDEIFKFIVYPVLTTAFIMIVSISCYKFLGKPLLGDSDILFLGMIMFLYGVQNGMIIFIISAYFGIFGVIYKVYKNKKSKTKDNTIPYGIYIFLSLLSYEFYKIPLGELLGYTL